MMLNTVKFEVTQQPQLEASGIGMQATASPPLWDEPPGGWWEKDGNTEF